LVDDDPSFDEDHPRRRQLETEVGSIAYDDLPAEGALRRFYTWDPLTRFIGAVLGHESFYRSADPLGAVSVNVFEPGAGHAWHFDESLFSVTLMLQTAERGGGSSTYPTFVAPAMTLTKRLGAFSTAIAVRPYGYLSSRGRYSSFRVATPCIASPG
jgi:hypothetical protein